MEHPDPPQNDGSAWNPDRQHPPVGPRFTTSDQDSFTPPAEPPDAVSAEPPEAVSHVSGPEASAPGVAHKIAFINQKGGVGKTTLTTNCGAYWARQGRRVLMLDLDPQAHLSLHLGMSDVEKNLYRVLRGDIALTDAVHRLEDEQIDLIPAHIDLSAAEWEFGQEVGREVILREMLATFLESHPYDLVLMDCAPSLGFLSLNALSAVDDVVIPVQAEFFALQGMAQLLRVLEMVKGRLHPGLQWRAIVPTLVDGRTNLGREVIAELERHFPGSVTRSWVSKRVKVAEAPSFGQSIFQYAPESPGALEFATLAKELEKQLEFPEVPVRPKPVDGSPESSPAESPSAVAEASASESPPIEAVDPPQEDAPAPSDPVTPSPYSPTEPTSPQAEAPESESTSDSSVESSSRIHGDAL